jgi:N-carbamoylputrescine amidase
MPTKSPSKKPVTLGLIQMAMAATPTENLTKAITLVTRAAKRGAQIICLPELFATPYFPQVEHDKAAFETTEFIPGRRMSSPRSRRSSKS